MYKKACITTFPFFRLHLLHMSCVTSCIIFFTLRTNLWDLSRKSHDAPVPYPTMHQKCAHMPHTWDTFLMHWGTCKMDLIRIITLLSRHPLPVIDYQFPLSDIRATLVISSYGDKKNKQHKKIEWLPPLRSFKMFTGPLFEIKLYKYCLTQWISKLHWIQWLRQSLVNMTGVAGILSATFYKTESVFTGLGHGKLA